MPISNDILSTIDDKKSLLLDYANGYIYANVSNKAWRVRNHNHASYISGITL